MQVVQERFVELIITHGHRDLTEQEEQELFESYQFLKQRYWKLAKLKNMLTLAYKTNDMDWVRQLIREIDKVMHG